MFYFVCCKVSTLFGLFMLVFFVISLTAALVADDMWGDAAKGTRDFGKHC
jgi:hypothetical protein